MSEFEGWVVSGRVVTRMHLQTCVYNYISVCVCVCVCCGACACAVV